MRPKKRSPEERERVYGGDARIAWTKTQRCVVTGRTPCEVVHVRTGGLSRKADACWTVPMVREAHRELHRIGVKSFEAKYRVSLYALAALTEARFQEHLRSKERAE